MILQRKKIAAVIIVASPFIGMLLFWKWYTYPRVLYDFRNEDVAFEVVQDILDDDFTFRVLIMYRNSKSDEKVFFIADDMPRLSNRLVFQLEGGFLYARDRVSEKPFFCFDYKDGVLTVFRDCPVFHGAS